MSFILTWRRVVLVCVLLIAAAGVVGAWRSSPRADAQEPPGSFTVISNGILVTASNGHATLPVGINDGIFGITCTGSAPRGGTPRIPGQVVTEVTVNDTLLRIIQYNGVMVTGTVRINCVIEVQATPEGAATADRLRGAVNAG